MSWYEVETKVKVGDEKELRKKIKKIARFKKKVVKRDVYYAIVKNGYPKKAFRLRNTIGKSVMNFKVWNSKKSDIDVVVKREYEMEVDKEDFMVFLKDIGFRKWIEKVKYNETYFCEGVNVELNKVEKLGWFMEIEVLCDKKDIEKSKKKIRNILNKLEINKKDISNIGYTKLLWKLKK